MVELSRIPIARAPCPCRRGTGFRQKVPGRQGPDRLAFPARREVPLDHRRRGGRRHSTWRSGGEHRTPGLSAGRTNGVVSVVLSRLAVKTSGDLASAREALKQAVWAIDRNLPLTGVLTLDETLVLGQAERRFQTFFSASLQRSRFCSRWSACTALWPTRYPSARPRSGFGWHSAPGRDRSFAWAISDAVRPLALGTALGIAIAVLLSRAVSSQLFGVTPWDVTTYALAGGGARDWSRSAPPGSPRVARPGSIRSTALR